MGDKKNIKEGFEYKDFDSIFTEEEKKDPKVLLENCKHLLEEVTNFKKENEQLVEEKVQLETKVGELERLSSLGNELYLLLHETYQDLENQLKVGSLLLSNVKIKLDNLLSKYSNNKEL